MRTRHLLTAALALAVLASLTACATPAKLYEKHHPTPSATPVFSSEEEALAAAEAAYAAYLAASDSIANDGGARAERIDEFVTGDFREQTLAGFADFVTKGYRSVGRTQLASFSIQQFDPGSKGPAMVSAYACQDLSAVDVVDSSGKSVAAADRPDQIYLEVIFDLERERLLVAAQDLWGDGKC